MLCFRVKVNVFAKSNERTRRFYSEAKKVQHAQCKDKCFSIQIVMSVTIDISTSDAFYGEVFTITHLMNCFT